jgi:hypothetical protein
LTKIQDLASLANDFAQNDVQTYLKQFDSAQN